MVVRYNPKRPAQALMRYNGTLWEEVLKDPWFWFFLGVNVTFMVLRYTDVLLKKDAPAIPASTLAIIGSLVSFSSVFFVNDVYKRFHDQLFLMISMGGTVINITSLCVATFRGPKANARAMQMARYGNALTHQCFYSISKVDNIDYLVHKNMITDEEGQLIRNFRGKKTNLIASWLLDTLEMARHEQMAADDNCGVDAQETMEMIFIIRGKASKLQELQKLPPPLSYYHFLVVTLYSWLLLLAYSTPYLPERNSRVWLSFLCYFVVLFSYMGLIATAFAHVDPWGTDTSDIDVLTRLDGTLRQSQLICEDKFHAAKRDLEPPTTPFNSEILENPALKYRTVAEEEQAQEAKENHNNLPSILQVLRKRSTLVDKYCQTNDMSELGGLVLEHHRPSSPSFKDHPANQSTSVDVPTNKKEPVKLVQQQPKERQCTILR